MWQCDQLLLVGAGNMGAAIVQGVLRARVLAPKQIVAVDPGPAQRANMQGLGVHAVAHLPDVPQCAGSRVVLLAIKPQKLDEFAAQWRDVSQAHITNCELIVSILAGATRERVAKALGGQVPCIRAMPNLPAILGAGVTAICHSEVPQHLQHFAHNIFVAIGPCVLQVEESQLDGFTGVAGSGPAYVFLLAQAMIEGAQDVGLTKDQAHAAVVQTIAGAAAMLAEHDANPTTLRERVTSPGGTTQAALAVLHEREFSQAMRAAIKAARDRGRELGLRP